MKKIFLLLLFAFALPSFGQSISIFDIDTSAFPIMKAKFYAFDSLGNQVRPTASELTITENGINRNITNVSCPAPKPIQTVSVAMSIDVSGSMNYSGFVDVPVELGKTTASELCNEISMPPSEFSLQTCDATAYIIQDFTKNKKKILNSIPPINAGGNNDFVEHLLNKLTGVLNIAKNGKYKRVAVLYTDAWWYVLTKNELQQCLDTCSKYNIEFYAIIYSRKEAEPNGIKASLNEIANKTGGQLYDGITSSKAAKEIATRIQRVIQGDDPCDILWESKRSCNIDMVNLKLKWINASNDISYYSSLNSIAKLEIQPNTIYFKNKEVNKKFDTIITIKAINSDFNVSNIISSNTIYDISPKSFFIKKGESKNLTLSYTPLDSIYSFSKFEFQTDLCPINYYVSAYYSNPTKKPSSLKLTFPNGGEKFLVGSDSIITWNGISKYDTVKLKLSIDSGQTWKMISENAVDLKYKWRNILKPSSNKCLIKVEQNKFLNSSIILECNCEKINKINWSPDGTKIASASNDSKVIVWNAISGEIIYYLIGHNNEVNDISWSPDGTKIASASNDSDALIWDANNGNKLINLNVYVFGNVVNINWSPDGSKVAVASKGNSAKIFDSNSGVLLQELLHKTSLYNISWSPDGTKVATSSAYKPSNIWDANLGKLIQTLNEDTIGTVKILWSPDGTKVATIGTSCKIWDPKTGLLLNDLYCNSYINNFCWSPDGTKIATSNSDYTAKIFDSNNGVLLQNFKQHLLSVLDVCWSPDGTKIATASSDKNCKIWDINTGKVLLNLIGHNQKVNQITWSPDGTKVATSSSDSTIRVWSVESILQSDISDSVFSIVAPSPSSKDIDMKKCLLGNAKDSLIIDLVMNKGSYKFRTDSIYFTGADASCFSLVSGFPPFELEAGKGKFVEIRFKPNRVGNHSAKINIITQSDTLIQNIIGEGVQPTLSVINIIDFGYVDIYSSKDSLQVVTIKNTGISDLDITNTYHLGPNNKDFSTLAGGGAFKLKAGETAKLDLRFAPKIMGRTSGRLMFDYNGPDSPATVQLFGAGIGGKAVIKIDTIEAKTGEIVNIPIRLTLDSKVIKSGTKAFNFEIAFNKTLLFPLENYSSTFDGDNRVLKFENIPINNNPEQILLNLKFISALGNSDLSALEIRNLEPIGNTEDIDIEQHNGLLKLTNVCYDGGERLLNGSKQTNLFSIMPNPANESIEINYSNADNGIAEFRLIDVLGQTVSLINLEKVQNGKAKMNLYNLPSGKYIGIFSTESYNQNMIISVIK